MRKMMNKEPMMTMLMIMTRRKKMWMMRSTPTNAGKDGKDGKEDEDDMVDNRLQG